jgi:transposase
MQDRKLFEQILGITSPWSVDRVELKLEAGEVHVYVTDDVKAEWCCPECGKPCPLHDHEPSRSWRHLDTCQYRTLLHTAVPRTKCPEHGVLTVRVPWAEPNSRFTALFERLAIDWMQEAGRSAVARRMGLTWDQADGIMRRAVRRGLARREERVVAQIGVDEKSFQRRHEYVTTVCDLDRGHVLYVGDDRKQETLERFYRQLTPEQLDGIEAVAMDMWDPYAAATRKYVPRAAEKIVFDKFHISKHLNDGVDKVRRQEHKQLQSSDDDRLKGTKYSWLKSPHNFTHKSWRDFGPLRKSKLRTARGWAIKETFRHFWEYTYPKSAEKFFTRWYSWATRSRLAPIKKVAKMLKRRLANLMTYFKHPITNAMSESLNAKIQWIKYTAHGFRSREGFRTAIYFHCGGLDLYPQ